MIEEGSPDMETTGRFSRRDLLYECGTLKIALKGKATTVDPHTSNSS